MSIMALLRAVAQHVLISVYSPAGWLQESSLSD
jgi:hypothetical protein